MKVYDEWWSSSLMGIPSTYKVVLSSADGTVLFCHPCVMSAVFPQGVCLGECVCTSCCFASLPPMAFSVGAGIDTIPHVYIVVFLPLCLPSGFLVSVFLRFWNDHGLYVICFKEPPPGKKGQKPLVFRIISSQLFPVERLRDST